MQGSDNEGHGQVFGGGSHRVHTVLAAAGLQALLIGARLFAIHGRDWTTIAEEMGRTPGSVRDHSRTIHQTVGKMSSHATYCTNTGYYGLYVSCFPTHRSAVSPAALGQWTSEEEAKLAELMQSYAGKDVIPWTVIAAGIGTRTPIQCRRKWCVCLYLGLPCAGAQTYESVVSLACASLDVPFRQIMFLAALVWLCLTPL